MSKLVQTILVTFLSLVGLSSWAANIEVSQGHVREVIPGNTITSAYMQITNKSDKAISLVAATSNISDRIEIHTHTMAGGLMKMRQIEQLDIPSQQTAKLQPMGDHLMIFELNKALKQGQEVDITLQFSNGSSKTVRLPVQSIKNNKQKNKHHHHH